MKAINQKTVSPLCSDQHAAIINQSQRAPRSIAANLFDALQLSDTYFVRSDTCKGATYATDLLCISEAEPMEASTANIREPK